MSLNIGLDGNQPINIENGRINPQVADPSIIADTGTGWVRINFILGPWTSPDDTTARGPNHLTWEQTYRQIINGFRQRNVKIYGLIDETAAFTSLNDQLREPPAWPSSGLPMNSWIDEYVENFAKIVAMFPDIEIFESFNEPDDWHAETRNWIHPEWFAVILQRIYDEVRRESHVKLISGSVQGLTINDNAGARYLDAVYQTGQTKLHWGTTGRPFPFDGVGYHIYVAEDFTADQAAQDKKIRNAYRSYLSEVLQKLQKHHLGSKQLYISEMGWHTNGPNRDAREKFQADSLHTAFDFLRSNPDIAPHIAYVSLFCTQDFDATTNDKYYGLYRTSGVTVNDRKAAYNTFKSICEA